MNKILISELSKILKPYDLLCDKDSISSVYRMLHLSPQGIRGCSMVGVMESTVDLGIQEEVFINEHTFSQIINSLPEGAELSLAVRGHSLHWKCGTAKGALSLLSPDSPMPALPWKIQPECEIDEHFAERFNLGMLSCGSTSVFSFGLYGMMLDNTTNLAAYSSDIETFSICHIGPKVPSEVSSVTLSPEAAKILAFVSRDKGKIAFDASSLYFESEECRLVLKQKEALKLHLPTASQEFQGEDIQVILDADVISAFIRRVDILSDDKRKQRVSISVEEGALKLGFFGDNAESTDYYMLPAEKTIPDLLIPSVFLEAKRLSTALKYTDTILFDHTERGALVLKGGDHFRFVISIYGDSSRQS